MKRTRKDLIKYRMDRAKESVDEAIVLADTNHWNTASNRLYYGQFYAVSALLLHHEIPGSTHSGVKGQFHKHFVKTGKVSMELGKLYNSLFNKRQEGDYGDFQRFDEKTIAPLIPKVKQFLVEIENLIRLHQ